MVCPPIRGDNPRALTRGLSPVQADKQWYYYFIAPSSLYTLLSMKYLVLRQGWYMMLISSVVLVVCVKVEGKKSI